MSTFDTCSSGLELGTRTAAPSRNWFQRMYDRLVESRTRSAEAYLRQHRHLVPQEIEARSNWKISERTEDSLPFIR